MLNPPIWGVFVIFDVLDKVVGEWYNTVMPDGKTHRAFNKRYTPFALMLGGMGLLMALPAGLQFAGLFAVGYLVGLLLLSRWCDPDLDQLGMTAAEGRAMNDLRKVRIPRKGLRRYLRLFLREVGGWIGFLWVWWMMPYAYIMRYFGGHRGLSHTYIIGTVTRVVWAFWPLYVAWWWYYYPWIGLVLPSALGCFLGLCVMGAVSILLTTLLAVYAGRSPTVRYLLIAAIICMIVAGVVTRFENQPINREVMTWQVQSLPENWTALRDRWWTWHIVRTLAAISAFGLLAVAFLSENNPLTPDDAAA